MNQVLEKKVLSLHGLQSTWSAFWGDPNILETERVCGRHFHQGHFTPDWEPSQKLGKKEYRRPKDFKASVERSERVERRRKAAIEQPEQEATKKRKLLEQSGDHICDLDFESEAGTSETTEEQLTDEMDTDNVCDGQGAKCETKEFAHSSTQTEPEVASTAASEGTHLQKQVKIRVPQKLRQRNHRPHE